MFGIIRFLLFPSLLVGSWLVLSCGQAFADNERYKAIPMAAGGYVFILDTREGHAWTWTSAGAGHVSKTGENPRFTYQGNVRMNMKPPKKNEPGSEKTKNQAERY